MVSSEVVEPSTSRAGSSKSSKGKGRQGPDPQSAQYAIISGVAGGLAGCIAKTSVAPLDRVKILFQTKSPDYLKYAGTWFGVFRAGKVIYQENGLRGLLQGHSATLLRIFPYAAIKYAFYDKFHHFLMPTPKDETSSLRFLAGSLSGVTSTAITYPLELIRVRLAFERHTTSSPASLRATINQIYREPPLPLSSVSSLQSLAGFADPIVPVAPRPPSLMNFYRGVFPTLAGVIPYAGTSFLVWGYLKHDLLPQYATEEFRKAHLGTLDLLMGGIAGAIGQTAAYPLDIVRRRMQVGPAITPGRRSGFWETAQNIYKQSGWRGFFVGLSIGFIKVAPMNAVSFASWQALKTIFGLER